MVEAFLISFGIIFVAELGDKSQLMAMTFAARYRALTILLAITAATAVVHLVSVLFGAVVGVALPTKGISILGGLAFLGFAVWTLRGDELDEDDEARAARASKSVVFTVA
ncbi:MAG: TMEM165/GDT1 family protein, partial [Acidimicrobiia bacterium]